MKRLLVVIVGMAILTTGVLIGGAEEGMKCAVTFSDGAEFCQVACPIGEYAVCWGAYHESQAESDGDCVCMSAEILRQTFRPHEHSQLPDAESIEKGGAQKEERLIINPEDETD